MWFVSLVQALPRDYRIILYFVLLPPTFCFHATIIHLSLLDLPFTRLIAYSLPNLNSSSWLLPNVREENGEDNFSINLHYFINSLRESVTEPQTSTTCDISKIHYCILFIRNEFQVINEKYNILRSSNFALNPIKRNNKWECFFISFILPTMKTLKCNASVKFTKITEWHLASVTTSHEANLQDLQDW